MQDHSAIPFIFAMLLEVVATADTLQRQRAFDPVIQEPNLAQQTATSHACFPALQFLCADNHLSHFHAIATSATKASIASGVVALA